MQLHRQISKWAIDSDFLRERMSFIAGPRQIGKTTFIQQHLEKLFQPQLYYNWDTLTVRKKFSEDPLFFIKDLPQEVVRPWVAFDEIHKYPKWKNLLKGYYDEWKKRLQIVITGSARLDHFRKSGDSLIGRYFLFKMLPIGMRELIATPPIPYKEWSPNQELSQIPLAADGAHEAIETLLNTTGFPEPLSVGTTEYCNRWRNDHITLLIRDDLRDLTKITELAKLETLVYLLPERVGSPLSLNGLRTTLECAHGSLSLWLSALKNVYMIFSLSPWTQQLSRSILKEKKYYFWDWGMVQSEGNRFENFIAVSLERTINAWNEWGMGPFKLYYIRTKDGKEVDFAVADRKHILMLVEVKLSDESVSPNLVTFKEKFKVPFAFQVIAKKQFCIQKSHGLYVIGADRFLSILC